MADRSTGPVKPPVIDLTARTGARSEGEARPSEGAAAGAGHRGDAAPRFRLSFDNNANWPLIAGAAVGGAILGTLLTYLLATVLPLPVRQAPQPPDLTAFVNTQGEQITTLTQQLGTLQESAKKTQVSLDATIAQLDGDIAAVNKSIADLKASPPTATPSVDLAPIEDQLKTLKAQVDAMAAGASGADAGAMARTLSQLQAGVESITTRLNGVDQAVAAVRSDLDAARKSLADHLNAALPSEIGPAMKLPLILSGLEGAFATGRPFQSELGALLAVIPDIAVPAPLSAAAPSGLSRPDAVTQKFEAALPDILAARDHGTGDWTQSAVDWAKSLLALRPAQEQEGDSPDAVISRLEGAVSRHDYATANGLMMKLPASMQAAAAPVASDIGAHAAAEQLLADLRSRALTSTDVKP